MYQIHLCLIKYNLHDSLYFIWLPVERFAEAIWIELDLNSWSGIQPGHSCYNCCNFLKIMPHCWHYPSFSSYCSCLQELLPSSCVYRRNRQWFWTQRGRINLCVMAGENFMLTTRPKEAKLWDSRVNVTCLLGFQSLPLPLQSKHSALESKLNQIPLAEASGEPEWNVHTRAEQSSEVLGSPDAPPDCHVCHLFWARSHWAARGSPCSG